jgi:hypothetical protein
MASKPVTYTFAPPPGVPARSGLPDPRRVEIHDGRRLLGAPSLDVEGFRLVRQATRVKNFYDDEEVRTTYYAEIEALIREETGASSVVIFDHTRRSGSERQREDTGGREPVHSVHNDYTARSGRRRLFDHLPADVAEGTRRHAIINVWRSISGPVEDVPLAVADARSVEPDDLVAGDLVYPDKVGEVYAVRYNPRHRWYYFPKMEVGEALLIKSYDSVEDGRARFTPHSAFADPTARPGVPHRESIEVRALALFA